MLPEPHFMSRIRRRDFIRLTGLAGAAALAGACSPTAPSTPEAKTAPTQAPAAKTDTASKPAASPSPQASGSTQQAPAQTVANTADWDKVVAEAQKEGKVAVTTLAGDGYIKVLDKFRAAYPSIEVEHKSAPSASNLAPPILQEQAGGVYSYDVCFLSPGGPIMGSMMPAGAFDDIGPAIIHPEAKDDKSWIGGLDSIYMDKAKKKVLALTWDQNQTIFYNSELVTTKPASIKDMADPKYTEKLTFMEYQTGFTYIVAVSMNYHMKEQAAEWIKKLFVDQRPTFVRDGRQAAESLIRGQTAFATGPTLPILEQFAAQGLGKNVIPLDVPEMKTISMYGILLYTKAPHPNAAKVMINWLMSKAGGTAITEHLRFNSRRADVPPINQAVYPGTDFDKVKREYLFSNTEEALPLQQQATEQLKKLIEG
jgi:ABC-type Fe3+ transport system substrate-binding protein